jgi:5-oxoprolinase (ATP-hydrolysing)
MKIVGRGDTTVVDAYLSPILRRYVDRIDRETEGVRLMFMQSNGGLVDAHKFQGKDAILSGPAGGIVGAAKTAPSPAFRRSLASTWAARPPTSPIMPVPSSAPSRPRWRACACGHR